MNKFFLMAVVGLLGAAGYVVSKRPDTVPKRPDITVEKDSNITVAKDSDIISADNIIHPDMVSKPSVITRSKPGSSFTVAFDCRRSIASWTGAPSNAGSIVLFGISDTEKSTKAVANIPTTRSRVTADDAYNPNNLPMFSSVGYPVKCCSAMLSDGPDYCPGDLEITAFAIQDPILVEKGKGYNNPSPAEIRDLAASKALESTSIIIQCPPLEEEHPLMDFECPQTEEQKQRLQKHGVRVKCQTPTMVACPSSIS